MKAGVERVQGHLHRIKRIAELEHLQVKSGVFVTGETDESGLALLLGSIKCFQDTPLGIGQLGVVVVDDAVDLPEVQMIGLEPPQRLFEHLERQSPAAPMRADFGH